MTAEQVDIHDPAGMAAWLRNRAVENRRVAKLPPSEWSHSGALLEHLAFRFDQAGDMVDRLVTELAQWQAVAAQRNVSLALIAQERDDERLKRQQAEHERDCAVQDVAKFRDLLQGICDEQNGPPLETRREQWQRAFDQARAALLPVKCEHRNTRRGADYNEWCDDCGGMLPSSSDVPADANRCATCGGQIVWLNATDETLLTEKGKSMVKDGKLPLCFTCHPLNEPSVTRK